MTALLVPAIVKFGVPIPAAHMFAFYFAILSAITPPVALAVYAAAGLAKSDLWMTGLAAVRIAATSFIVPFMFVYAPELLMIGDWPSIAMATVSASIGVVLFSSGLHGYFIGHSTHWQSVLLVVGGLMLIDPHWTTDVVGVVCAAIVIVTQLATRRAALKPEIAAE
jgi:TRAP-type uncharacterized transport system fused permease subunit